MTTAKIHRQVAEVIRNPVLFTKILYGFKNLGKKHEELLRLDGEINVIVAGRRFGKTTYLSARAFRNALLHPNTTTLITAPSVDQAKIYFDLLMSALERNPFNDEVAAKPHPFLQFVNDVRNAPFPELTLVNGSRIVVRSTARGGRYLRGRKVHQIYVTEAAFVDDEVFQNVILPMRLDTKAKIFLESTPYGRNYFHEFYQQGLHDTTGFVQVFHATAYDNPFVDPQEIEQQKTKLPDYVFQQEYLAEFVDDSRAVFGWQVLKRAFDDDYEPVGYIPSHRYVIGLDIAQMYDFTVFIVLDITREPYKIAEIVKFNNTSYDYIVETANRLSATYVENPALGLGRAPVYVDATAVGRPLAEKIANSVPVSMSMRTKAELIENLHLLMSENKLKLPPKDTALRDELRYFRYEEANRTVKMNAARGYHDDMVIALALACWEVREGSFVGSFSIDL